jgi:hypothetical protein
VDCVIDGAWGDIKALMGIDTCDMLRRESEGRTCLSVERTDATFDVARERLAGWTREARLSMLVRLEPGCPCLRTEPDLDCDGEFTGVDPDSLGRLLAKDEGAWEEEADSPDVRWTFTMISRR